MSRDLVSLFNQVFNQIFFMLLIVDIFLFIRVCLIQSLLFFCFTFYVIDNHDDCRVVKSFIDFQMVKKCYLSYCVHDISS